MVDYTFLQPRGGQFLDGGGAYTRNLIAALRDAGHDVTVSAELVAPQGGTVVVDGRDLDAFAGEGIGSAIGLIHQFASLPQAAMLPQLRRVVTTSDAAAARLAAEFGLQREQITTVLPGVPEVGRSPGSGGPHCQILSVGALVPRKGHAVLIAALRKLFDLDWRLTIVGDADRDPVTAAELQTVAEQTGGRVCLAGPLAEDALETLWSQADLFALATEWEGYAAPVAEAMRRGVPVAITTGAAAGDLITPQTGIICHAGDVTQLSKSLRRLIFDTDLRAAMAEAAWQKGRSLPTWRQQAVCFVAATA